MQEYKEAFEPLLLEECAAQIMRGVEEGEVISPHPCVVSAHELVSLAVAGCCRGAGRQGQAFKSGCYRVLWGGGRW